MDARVYAFDLSLNSIWDKSIGGEISTTPSISHDNATLYITTNNGMLKAVDPLTGQAIWNYVAYGSVFQTPLYLVTPSAERVIYFIAKESSGKSYLYAVKFILYNGKWYDAITLEILPATTIELTTTVLFIMIGQETLVAKYSYPEWEEGLIMGLACLFKPLLLDTCFWY
ncbi:MAG: PQQ-binding-like beta-propeller repeat protein [Ignavibacteriales bacterium]|nr:PQQ-binding-like beta-propeller repeat protein [Ignavibacteriales bacterium]